MAQRGREAAARRGYPRAGEFRGSSLRHDLTAAGARPYGCTLTGDTRRVGNPWQRNYRPVQASPGAATDTALRAPATEAKKTEQKAGE